MNVVTTDAARVSAITWQIAVELSSTHCHQVLPLTRAEVSSEPTTGAHDRAFAHRRRDRRSGSEQRRLGTGQDVGDRAFAEGQAEHLGQQADEALEADRLGHVQMDDQRAQPWPERRAGFKALRRRGGHALAAARADAAVAVDAGYDRADRRQVDVVVGVDVGLVGEAERMLAMRASGQCRLDDMVGVGRKCAGDAGVTAAGLLRELRTVWFLALGGRRARVARGLGRRVEPGFQLRNLCR